jgi:hypothetical protein
VRGSKKVLCLAAVDHILQSHHKRAWHSKALSILEIQYHLLLVKKDQA